MTFILYLEVGETELINYEIHALYRSRWLNWARNVLKQHAY